MTNGIVGKPVLMDKLDATLGAKVAAWIADDNERALAERDKKRKKKRRKAKKS